MKSWLRPLRSFAAALFAIAAVATSPASAHFVFVVPEPGAERAKMILSETLEPDDDVDVALIGKTSLSLRQTGKADSTKLDVAAGDGKSLLIKLTGDGPRVVHGALEYGVEKRGGKTFLLTYHPKTVLGDPFDAKTALADAAPAEIVASGKAGEVVFQVLSKGKPAAGAKITVIPPGGAKEQVLTTDGEGRTTAFKETGRFGVSARCVEPVAGERGGEKYEEVRRYPTLVIDVGDAARAAAQAVPASAAVSSENVPSKDFPKLPEATSSFGAAAADGWLYVYGGHIAPTHHYDTNAVSGLFHRIKLDGGTAWESLAGGPALQGMNVVAHGGRIYRIGGMRPLNAPGAEVDNRSVADVAAYDPAAKAWQPLPSLPEPRSSHDVVAVGDKLIVIGGWNMKGKDGNDWPKDALVLDLASPSPRWTPIAQPLQRRALIAAVLDGKVYVIGGFDENDDPSLNVMAFDPATSAWSAGPDLPGGRARNGFAPAACTLDGRLYVSVMDGNMYRLSDDGKQWDAVTKTTPRIVHRLVPHDGKILVLGGANRGGNFDLVEVVRPTAN